VSDHSEPTRVVIADDHAVVRRGLRALFDGHADLHVVAEASDVGETFDCVREHRPEVLLLDLHMGGRSSLTDITGLRDASAGTAVVVLTMQTDPLFAREALLAGAAGFVTKQAPDDAVIEAVRAVAAGGTYLDPTVGVGAVTGGPGAPAAIGDLSPRETAVLRMIALGHTNPEIAESLHVGLRTVETHRSHIQQKLGLSKRADLVRFALDHGLVGSER
jgi:two-component system, NarL family, response regulator NreC